MKQKGVVCLKLSDREGFTGISFTEQARSCMIITSFIPSLGITFREVVQSTSNYDFHAAIMRTLHGLGLVESDPDFHIAVADGSCNVKFQDGWLTIPAYIADGTTYKHILIDLKLYWHKVRERYDVLCKIDGEEVQDIWNYFCDNRGVRPEKE